jgi:hypothetical protein
LRFFRDPFFFTKNNKKREVKDEKEKERQSDRDKEEMQGERNRTIPLHHGKGVKEWSDTL